MTTETRAAFAARMGVNKSTVTRWAQAGRLVEDGKGKVLVAESQAKIAATMGHRGDVAARHAKDRGADIPEVHRGGESAQKPHSGASAGGEVAEGLPATGGRNRYQVLALQYENQTIKLEMALRRGIRQPRAAVRRESGGIGAMVRAALERLTDLTAPQLAAETNEAERRRLIESEIRRVRWTIKREFPRALRRMKQTGGLAA